MPVATARRVLEVFAFIEGFYDPRRRHSTLGHLRPAEYERQHQAARLTDTAA